MDAEQPFPAEHSHRLLFTTDAWRDCLDRLCEGLGSRPPFLLVTGEAGTGKSVLVLEAAARWGAHAVVAILADPPATPDQLVQEIAGRFGAECRRGRGKPEVLAALERTLADVTAHGQVPVLVVEDAHRLEPQVLEELRALVTSEAEAHRPFEVMLVGLPAIDGRLAEPAMESLRQRISVRCHLNPLSRKETRHYLHHRVGAAGGDGPHLFSRKTCAEIHARTRGVTRAINRVAAEAMRAAAAAGQDAVTPDHVRAAAAKLRVGATSAPVLVEPETPSGRAAGPTPASSAQKPARAPAAAASEPATPAVEPTRAEEIASGAPAGSDGAGAAGAASAPPSAAVAAEPAGSGSEDPRVREWVKRFIGDQGPPRIGAALWEPLPLESEFRAEAENQSESEPMVPQGGRQPATRREPDSESGLDEPVVPARPGRRARRPGGAPRRQTRARSWTTAPLAAVVVFAIAALGTLTVLSRGREWGSRPSASTVAAEGTTAEQPAAQADAGVPAPGYEPAAPTSSALAARLRRLTYLTAERLGPREVYALEDPQVATVVGPAGEFAPAAGRRGDVGAAGS